MNDVPTKAPPTASQRSPPVAGGWFQPLAAGRSRSLHWLASAAALVSLATLWLWAWGRPGPVPDAVLQWTDLTLAAFFALELFTRTGWLQSRLTYLKWHWFDFVAILPLTVLGPAAVAPLVWIVLASRLVRLVDRTLGDGYVQRNTLILIGALEEEISDRVLANMLSRWERDLDHARFGSSIARALARNQEAVLRRVFAEQLQDGAFAKVAHFTGLQSGIEREERRLFEALIATLGSPEMDEALRDVLASSLRRGRAQLSTRDWRAKLSAASRMTATSPAAAAPSVTAAPTARAAARAPVARSRPRHA